MHKGIMKPAYMILMVSLLFGCSAIEIRSPIVLKKPKPEEPPVASQTATVAPAPRDSAMGEQTPAVPSPPPQSREGAAIEEPAPATPGITEKTPSQEYASGITSPASIPVLSQQDLTDYRFSVLGRVEANSPSKEWFTQEKALQNLKVEAYKRYGNLAQGIINVDYKRGGTPLLAKKDLYAGVSADVITLVKKGTPEQEGAGTTPTVPSTPGGISTQQTAEDIPALAQISLLSSDDLFRRTFKILGTVSIYDESKKGFTEEQAIRGLKIEAFRLYGVQAKALTRIKLIKESPVFYYKKTQSNKSPGESTAFFKASAEVVTWPSN